MPMFVLKHDSRHKAYTCTTLVGVTILSVFGLRHRRNEVPYHLDLLKHVLDGKMVPCLSPQKRGTSASCPSWMVSRTEDSLVTLPRKPAQHTVHYLQKRHGKILYQTIHLDIKRGSTLKQETHIVLASAMSSQDRGP